MGNNNSGGSGGASSSRASTFNSTAAAPPQRQMAKLTKPRAKNVNMKTYTTGPDAGEYTSTQFSPPRDNGPGKFYQKTVDSSGETTFFDKWNKGEK